jgi:hypothetical protein
MEVTVAMLLGVAYIVAIAACLLGAGTRPRYRGPLIALGVVLLVPVVVGALIVFYLVIAFSRGASFG